MKRLLSLSLIALTLTACADSTAALHARAEAVWSGLETSTCDLPCWHGLVPGESSWEDVRQVLNSREFVAGFDCVDFEAAQEQGRAGGFCYWQSIPGEPIWGGTFEFAREGGERLKHILFYLRAPVPFEEAVAHFGEPGAVSANQRGSSGDACACPDRMAPRDAEEGPNFDLLYPERGLIVSAFVEPPDEWPCICRLTGIDALTLVTPGSADDLDAWWREVWSYSLEGEGGLFFDFPGWETRFD